MRDYENNQSGVHSVYNTYIYIHTYTQTKPTCALQLHCMHVDAYVCDDMYTFVRKKYVMICQNYSNILLCMHE